MHGFHGGKQNSNAEGQRDREAEKGTEKEENNFFMKKFTSLYSLPLYYSALEIFLIRVICEIRGPPFLAC
jgi:hypothetical protein